MNWDDGAKVVEYHQKVIQAFPWEWLRSTIQSTLGGGGGGGVQQLFINAPIYLSLTNNKEPAFAEDIYKNT